MSSLSILEVPVELISFSDDILFISSFVVEFDVVFVSFASSMLYNIDLGNSSSITFGASSSSAKYTQTPLVNAGSPGNVSFFTSLKFNSTKYGT